jgi:hypothetical protein
MAWIAKRASFTLTVGSGFGVLPFARWLWSARAWGASGKTRPQGLQMDGYDILPLDGQYLIYFYAGSWYHTGCSDEDFDGTVR